MFILLHILFFDRHMSCVGVVSMFSIYSSCYTSLMVKYIKHTTIGLAMIMKDEIEDFDRIIIDYAEYFDTIYVTITDKKTYEQLKKRPDNNQKVKLSYFEWIDHFGKARIYNQKQIETDYWMWIDSDDEIEGAEGIPAIPKYMDTNNLDDVWLPYDYTRRISLTEGETATWRERVIRTGSRLKWSDDAVHENINAPGDNSENFLSNIIIKHRRTAEQQQSSMERNKKILEKEWKQRQRVPTAYYLGATYKDSGDYTAAIEKLLFVVRYDATSPALKFKAWQLLFDCYIKTNDLEMALFATDACIAITSAHPAPWYQRFTAYRALGHDVAAMQIAEIAMSIHIDPESELAVVLGYDPSLSQYRGPFTVAQAYLSIGGVERAYQLYSRVKEVAPQYIEELSATQKIEWSDIFEKTYYEFINKTA